MPHWKWARLANKLKFRQMRHSSKHNAHASAESLKPSACWSCRRMDEIQPRWSKLRVLLFRRARRRVEAWKEAKEGGPLQLPAASRLGSPAYWSLGVRTSL